MGQQTPNLRLMMKDHRYCVAVRDFIAHFANPVRLKVLCYLTGGRSRVSAIVEAVGEKQSTVSQQLKHLLLAGLVSRERHGNEVHYEVADPNVLATMQFLSTLAHSLAPDAAAEANLSDAATTGAPPIA